MKKTNLRIIFGCLATVAISALLVFTMACESESVDAVITISPNGTRISTHGTVQLTASGGWDYRWSLSNASLGLLSSSVGSSVTYTAFGEGTQVVHVSAMGGSNSATNGASYTAECTIIQGNPGAEASKAAE